MGPVVDPQLVHGDAGDRVRVDRLVRLRHRVVADEDRRVEGFAVGPFELAVVLGVARSCHQLGGGVKILDEQIAHRAVTVCYQDVVRARLDHPLDRGVGVAGHQLATPAILGLPRHHHVGVDDSRNPLDVD